MNRRYILPLTRYTLLLILPLLFAGCAMKKNTPEIAWEQLFNGKDINDWTVKIRNHDLNDNFGNTFRVNDGMLQVRYDGYTEFDKMYGHLFFKNPYSYYLIGVEYRFTGEQVNGGEGWALRNSGIMIHGQDPATMSKGQDFPNSIEVQLLGGSGQGERSTANLCTPGTQYVKDGKVVKTHCVSSSSKTFHGEQWVRVEVLVLGDSVITHYVNGEEVLSYQNPQKDNGELIKGGTISLQSESHPIDFRKVEIIDLEKYAKDPVKLKQTVDKLMAVKRTAN